MRTFERPARRRRGRLAPLAALLALGAACTPAAAHAATAPVAAYGFEETGTTAGDASGLGNAGTVTGGATRAPGRFGSALSFDGADDLVRIRDAGPLNLASGMTLEAWVKPAAGGGARTILLKGRRTGLSYALDAGASPGAQVSAGAETASARAASELPVGAWRHLAATYDGAALRLYVNGAKVATAARPGPLTPGDGALTIGGNELAGDFFAGLVDEVRIYDRALAAAEIAADMAKPVGAPAAAHAPARDQVGAWAPPVAWPIVAVHASMLSNGKVVAWDGFNAAVDSEQVWNPDTGAFEPAPSGVNLFCSGHVLLPDGRLFVAGGHVEAYKGLKSTMLLNPLAGSWTAGPDMARGRWYPTTTTLADGRVLIVSGDAITTGGPNTPFIAPADTIPELYDPATNRITALPGARRTMPLYPFMFLAPDGRVVDAGPDTTTRLLDPRTGTWSTLASRSPIDGHSAVMYRPGKILKTGTWTDTEFPTDVPVGNGAAVLDLDRDVPAWRTVAPMKWARTFHTLTVLPDGDVLALGGQSLSNANVLPESPVLQPEIWHPETGTWTPVASSVRPRGYHNTSLLLPDGRILLAGSGRLDGSTMTDETTAEIYSPPYLFKGPRPAIAGAPSTLEYGGKAAIATPDAARIARVSLVRMGAVTHNFNMDQRWQELSFRRSGTGLEIDAPASGTIAPPGVYYVFLVDDKGVPSKAAIVSISKAAPGGGAAAPQPAASPARGALATKPSVRARRLASGKVRLHVEGRIGAGQGGCAGAVRIGVRRGRHRVAAARVALGPDCRFARTIVLSRAQAGHARRLRVTVRFPGNAAFAPARRALRVKIR